jgi:branched-chain amino acid transport system permease protein
MNTIVQLVISGLLIGSIYALMSIGLTLIFGVLRVVNFAHGEFLMIAMYGAWAFSRLLGLNPYFAVVAVVPAMFLFGALVYRLIIGSAMAKPHLVVVFATMGLSIFLQNIALMAMTADLRDVPPIFARSISIGHIFIKGELLLGFVVTLACTIALQWIIKRTFLGKAIRATVQDGEAAKLMGIDVPSPSPPVLRWSVLRPA